MPIDEELTQIAQKAVRQGRPVYLVTASEAQVTVQLARHFSFLTGVIRSMQGAEIGEDEKIAALMHRFPDGFDYASRASTGPNVRKRHQTVTLVPTGQPSRETLQATRTVFHCLTSLGKCGLVRALRMRHWTKNLLVFIPIFLAGELTDWTALSNTILAFFAIGFVASATYLINDMFDLTEDRRHWSKRYRPLANGQLPFKIAAIVALLGIALGLLTGALISFKVLGFLCIYLAITLAYSAGLKRIPIVDGVVLATLFTVRIGIGITAADVRPSAWLLVFSMLLFSSLSYAKRYTEITRGTKHGNNVVHARGYRGEDAPFLLALGIGTGLGAVIVMILYVMLDVFVATVYRNMIGLWFLPPFLFLFITRVWLVCHRHEMTDDPIDFVVRDRFSLVLGGLMTAAFGFAWLGPHWNPL